MLYHVLYSLHSSYSLFNVFRYISFRTLLSALMALTISFVLGPVLIRALTENRIGQPIRTDGPARHHVKAGTPTMGGTLILFSLLLSTLLLADLANPYIWLVLGVTIGFGLVGFVDDYRKYRHGNSAGLRARQKFLAQCGIAAIASLLLMQVPGFSPIVVMPFFKDVHLHLGWFYLPFAMLVLVGASNAVNLTDGLDGLAAGCTFVTALALAVITVFAPIGLNSAGLREDSAMIFAALAGSTLGFLWFNRHPAQVFMGDAGSLPIGGLLAVTALACRLELILALVGLVFVVETLSVIIQVAWYRRTKRRVLLCSPLHNHFVFRGIPERRIVCGFLIATVIFALAGLLQALAF